MRDSIHENETALTKFELSCPHCLWGVRDKCSCKVTLNATNHIVVRCIYTLADDTKGMEFFDGSSTYPTSKPLLHATVEPENSDSGRRLSDIGKLGSTEASYHKISYKFDFYRDFAKCDPRDSDAELSEWLGSDEVRAETYSIVIPKANHTSCPLSRALLLDCHLLCSTSFILPRIINTQVIFSASALTGPYFGAYLLRYLTSQ